MLVTIRYVSGTHDKFEMNRYEIETLSKWLLDDNSRNIFTYERQYCDNSKNFYNYEKKPHTCYIFKEKIEFIDFSNT